MVAKTQILGELGERTVLLPALIEEGLAANDRLIPRLTDQNRWAHPRIPMDMMRQGWSMSLFQASQQKSTICW